MTYFHILTGSREFCLIYIPVMLYSCSIGYNLALNLRYSMELEVSSVLAPNHVLSDNTLGRPCGFYIKIQTTLGRKYSEKNVCTKLSVYRVFLVIP